MGLTTLVLYFHRVLSPSHYSHQLFSIFSINFPLIYIPSTLMSIATLTTWLNLSKPILPYFVYNWRHSNTIPNTIISYPFFPNHSIHTQSCLCHVYAIQYDWPRRCFITKHIFEFKDTKISDSSLHFIHPDIFLTPSSKPPILSKYYIIPCLAQINFSITSPIIIDNFLFCFYFLFILSSAVLQYINLSCTFSRLFPTEETS